MNKSQNQTTNSQPSLLVSLVPVLFLILMLVINVLVFKDDASYGPNQLALLLAGMLTLGMGSFLLQIPYPKMVLVFLNHDNLLLDLLSIHHNNEYHLLIFYILY